MESFKWFKVLRYLLTIPTRVITPTTLHERLDPSTLYRQIILNRLHNKF